MDSPKVKHFKLKYIYNSRGGVELSGMCRADLHAVSLSEFNPWSEIFTWMNELLILNKWNLSSEDYCLRRQSVYFKQQPVYIFIVNLTEYKLWKQDFRALKWWFTISENWRVPWWAMATSFIHWYWFSSPQDVLNLSDSRKNWLQIALCLLEPRIIDFFQTRFFLALTII